MDLIKPRKLIIDLDNSGVLLVKFIDQAGIELVLRNSKKPVILKVDLNNIDIKDLEYNVSN